MDTLIPINILIGDRTYRIKVEPKDEEIVRKTVKTINEKILEFKTLFAGKDMQDYVSMVLIWYATELSGKETPILETAQLSEKLTAIEKMINEQLNTDE
ncbi:MAG: cell division protein ZapA [Chitinophagaceae bacterium]|jgi:cell division protein ZapA|nr:cell division protein ZapA [Chitinophagaceae bacterium]